MRNQGLDEAERCGRFPFSKRRRGHPVSRTSRIQRSNEWHGYFEFLAIIPLKLSSKSIAAAQMLIWGTNYSLQQLFVEREDGKGLEAWNSPCDHHVVTNWLILQPIKNRKREFSTSSAISNDFIFSDANFVSQVRNIFWFLASGNGDVAAKKNNR